MKAGGWGMEMQSPENRAENRRGRRRRAEIARLKLVLQRHREGVASQRHFGQNVDHHFQGKLQSCAPRPRLVCWSVSSRRQHLR